MSQFPAALNPKEEDVQKMLACSVHLGAKNMDPSMERYVWKRRGDGINIINVQKTWEKITLAARIIAAVEHPQDICVISGRPQGQRAVLKFAKFTGAQALAGRYTPGTFTNQIQAKFLEPRLLILTDPRTDHQPLIESSYVNIPTIAFCDTDSPLLHVDVAIPCNNKGAHSLGLIWWLLAREVLYLKNVIPRGQPWDVMPDLFFFRDPEKEQNEAEKFANANANNSNTNNANNNSNQQNNQQNAESWNTGTDTTQTWEQTGSWAEGNTEHGGNWSGSAVPTQPWEDNQ